MAQNVISKNFVNCLRHLRLSSKVKSDREFALSLGFTPQNLSQILKGKRDVTLDLISNAVAKYDFNPEYLMTGQGEPISSTIDSSASSGLSFSSLPYIDNTTEETYLNSVKTGEKLQQTGFLYQGAEHKDDARIFRVQNRDLSPYISAGDRLITKRIPRSRWERLIRDNNIYVLVFDDEIVISRVINKLSRAQEIQIVNDVSEKIAQKSRKADELLEVWEITHVLIRWSKDLNNQSETLNEKLLSFQGSVEQNEQAIKNLNITLQKFLKQNRAQLSMF